MKIIDKKKFAKIALNKHIEAFIVHITFLLLIAIYLAKKAQIASLVTKKMQIEAKYLDFLNIFLKKKTLVLLATIKLNQYIIKLQKD